MRYLLIALPAGMTLLTSCSTVPSAPEVPGYVDTAEVIKAEPLYEPVQVARPVNECWMQRVTYAGTANTGYAGPVAGGIIGGVIANQLAKGRGKAPLTVAGALVGASIGQRLGTPAYRPPTTAHVRRCATVNRYEQRQQLVGYRVDYRYEGQTFTTRTHRHPGRYIRVRVDVDPVGGS